MKKIFIIPSLIGLSVLLSACTVPNLSKKTPPQPTPVVMVSPTPTIGKDNSLGQIEADLKATTVTEEDFSDLK